MGRTRTTEAEALRRRKAWLVARMRCGLKTAEIADLLGRSVETVRSYGKANGNVPTRVAIDRLKLHNLEQAVAVIEGKFGKGAVAHYTEARP
jgi:DNA-binding NarL/FixJ family response regulator